MKTVSYAYPGSPRATALGYSKTGCWIVEADGTETRVIPDTDDDAAAQAYACAAAIQQEWSPWSMFGPADLEKRIKP